jgi:hypothetical protein
MGGCFSNKKQKPEIEKVISNNKLTVAFASFNNEYVC